MHRIIWGMVITSMLSACATTRQAENNIQAQRVGAEQALNRGLAGTQAATITADAYIAAKRISLAAKTYAPPVLRQQITLVSADPLTLPEIAQRITRITNLPVRIAPELLTPASSGNTGAAPVPIVPAIQYGADKQADNRMILNYYGSLDGLLDMITARENAFWRADEGGVYLFRTTSRIFTLAAIPGTASVQNTVGGSASAILSASSQGGGLAGGQGGGTGGSGGASSAQTLSMDSTTLSTWTAVRDTVQTMLSSYGKVVVSPATGTLAVTDTPEVLNQVADYIDAENRNISRQVLVNIKVYRVSLNDGDNYGLRWNLLFRALSKNYGFNVESPNNPIAGAGGFNFTVLDTATGILGQWANSQAIVDALSTQGQVSLVTSASAVTLNNTPAPIRVVRQTQYPASIQTNLAANVGSTTSLTPGVITTGFSVNVLPHVLANNRVLLQFSMNLGSLLNLVSQTAGNTTVSFPDVSSTDFLQRVSMKSGSTLILSGFEESENRIDRQGMGSPKAWFAGGTQAASKRKNMVVVLITPLVQYSGE